MFRRAKTVESIEWFSGRESAGGRKHLSVASEKKETRVTDLNPRGGPGEKIKSESLGSSKITAIDPLDTKGQKLLHVIQFLKKHCQGEQR